MNILRRHVIKFTNTCQLAAHIQIMSDTHNFIIGDEDHLMTKILSVPVSISTVSIIENANEVSSRLIQGKSRLQKAR